VKPDSDIALERVQSETLGALLSIQSYREVDAGYFERLRSAVTDAVAFFSEEERVPPALLSELTQSANILRNEATAFPGRTAACLEMADWLEAQERVLARD
jgi:hypothetical protein